MNTKKILIICIIIILIIISILTASIFILNEKSNQTQEQRNNTLTENIGETKIKKVTDSSKFYTVANCISQYLSEINKNNTKYYGMNDNGQYEKIVEESYIKQNVYNLLSEDYIEKNNINLDNIYGYVYNITDQVIFVPIKMNVLTLENIQKYVTYGYILNAKNELVKEIYIIVNLDIDNKTFSIEQINNQYASIDKIQITDNEISIAKKDNNTFSYVNATPEYIVKQYLNTYKRLALSKPEVAYSYLDKEYRTAKFGNVENYKKYIEKNRTNILGATISKYKITSENEYKQYVCITEKDDYYIFRETDLMEYTLILDTYTIDLPEYIEKYNTESEKEKATLCIDKFIKNINAENYTLAYNMLSTGFKNNYFKTQESFENYVKQYFVGKTEVTFNGFQNEAEIYIYTVTLGKSEADTAKLQKKFNVKLGEGTKFELSFNVE